MYNYALCWMKVGNSIAADKKTETVNNFQEERIYFTLQLSRHTPLLREVRTGIQRCCLLAYSSLLAYPAFLQNPGPYHRQQAEPCHINYQSRKCITGLF